jgi:hypothetical protein
LKTAEEFKKECEEEAEKLIIKIISAIERALERRILATTLSMIFANGYVRTLTYEGVQSHLREFGWELEKFEYKMGELDVEIRLK